MEVQFLVGELRSHALQHGHTHKSHHHHFLVPASLGSQQVVIISSSTRVEALVLTEL